MIRDEIDGVADLVGARRDVILVEGIVAREGGINVVAAFERVADGGARVGKFAGKLSALLLFPDLFKLLEHELAVRSRRIDHLPGAFALAFDLLFVFGEFSLQSLFGVAFEPLVLGAQALGLLAIALHRQPIALEPLDHVFKPTVFLRDPRPRLTDDRRGQPEPLRDREGVGFTGRSDDQFIGRTERFKVELTGRVLHALGIERVRFQFRVVSRRGDP